jgi:hypothetical protein
MQVTVGHVPDVVDLRPGIGQRLGERHAGRPVVGVHPRVGTHAGIDQQQAVRMVDQVAEGGLDPGVAGAGLFGRADEIAEVDPAHVDVRHTCTVARKRKRPAS